jgi:hypothetical protein
MQFRNVEEILRQKIARCEDNMQEPILEEDLSIDDEEILEEKSAYIPSYGFLMNPIKMLTMNYPSAEINGFKLTIGTGLSPNFMMMHEIQMTPKKPQVQTGNPMMDMFAEKTPFYSLNLQYHHGTLTQTKQDVAFSLMGRTDSTGKMDAILFKSFGGLRAKLHSSFMNSNIMYSNTQLELEHQGRTTKQTLTAATHAISYNIMEKIGRNLLLGLELNYITMKNMIGTGLAARYTLSPSEKFYVQYSAMANMLTLGSSFKFGEETNVAVELEMGGQQQVSAASVGYRRKTKTYQVSSGFRTDGEVKSMFTYNHQMAYKLKLFLGGNLWKEDFKAGYAFAIGQTDD